MMELVETTVETQGNHIVITGQAARPAMERGRSHGAVDHAHAGAVQLTRADPSGCADERAGRIESIEGEVASSWSSDAGKVERQVEVIAVRGVAEEGVGQVAD